jgi:hypothetical protein
MKTPSSAVAITLVAVLRGFIALFSIARDDDRRQSGLSTA